MRICLYFLFLALLAGPVLVTAATLTWPGVAPCNDTLQACIDAATNNDTIQIDTNTPDTGDVEIKSNIKLTLAPAPGRKPVFVDAGIFIHNNSVATGSFNVTIRDLHFHHGMIHVKQTGTGTSAVELRNLILDAANSVQGAIALHADSGALNATLYNNDVRSNAPSDAYGVVSLKSYGGTLKVNASFNKVYTPAEYPPGAGILVDIANGSTDSAITLHANEIRGTFARAGIFLSGNGAGGPVTNFEANVFDNVIVPGDSTDAAGIHAIVGNGEMTANLYNNTITQANPGIVFSRWGSGDTGTFSGLMYNNLIRARGAGGIAIDGTNDISGSLMLNSKNLINGNTVNFTANANTITTNAGLVDDAFPRLAAGSPAIDAGTSTTTVRNSKGIPSLDADGLRRLKRGILGAAGTTIDIGAYEYGDAVFTHVASADTISGGSLSWISHPSTDGIADANLFTTPAMQDAVSISQQFIPWWNESDQWALMAENSANDIPTNAHFHILSAAAGASVFRHTSLSSPSSSTTLNDTSVNGKQDAFLLVSRTSSLSTHVSNPRPFGIYPWYNGTEWRWVVENFDGTSFPGSTSFSVYAQERSPNAFLVEVSAGNRNADNNLVLDHPLLNGTPCAMPLITAVQGSNYFANQGAYNLYYDDVSQRWGVFQFGNGGVMPLGARFHILVNPAQVHACSHTGLFSDGFEGP